MHVPTRVPRWMPWVILACLVVAFVVAAASLLPPRVEMAAQDGLLLAQVTVINPGGERRTNQTVVVRGGRIESIDARAPREPLSRVTRHLAGRYVLPGLIDMHVHLPPDVGGLRAAFDASFLSFGVTTVCQVGDVHDAFGVPGLAGRRGADAAPRLLQCGQLFAGAGASGAYSRRVARPGQAAAAVADLAARGVDCIMASATLSPEALVVGRDAARERGVPFFAHLPAPVADDGTPVSGGDVARSQAAAWAQLDAAAVQRVAQRGTEMRTAYVPTLSAWERIAQLGDPAFVQSASSRLLPRFYRDLLWNPAIALPRLAHTCGSGDLWLQLLAVPGAGATLESPPAHALDAMHAVLAGMRAGGVRLLAGSNTPFPVVLPGLSLHEEMAQLVTLGMTPEEVWAAATVRAGEALGVPLLGTLQTGAPADLLIYREDPTRDLRAWQSLEAVMVDGRIYSARSLAHALMAYAGYVARPLYDWLSMTAARYVLRGRAADSAAP